MGLVRGCSSLAYVVYQLWAPSALEQDFKEANTGASWLNLVTGVELAPSDTVEIHTGLSGPTGTAVEICEAGLDFVESLTDASGRVQVYAGGNAGTTVIARSVFADEFCDSM